MAPSAGTLRVGRYFLALVALLIVLYGIVFWPGQPRTPKLGLDLEGGAQVTLLAKTTDGRTPSKASMQLAQQIIDNRVNGLGVSAAQVQIEGNDRIVVSVPGKSGEAIQNVGNAFLLQFRPAIVNPIAATPSATASPSASASKSASTSAKPTASATAKQATPSASPSAHSRVVPHLAGSATPSASAAPSGSATPLTGSSPAATPGATVLGGTTVDQWKSLGFAPPVDAAAYNKLTATQQQAVQAVLAAWPCDNPNITPLDQPTKPLVTCDTAGATKYLLGAVIVPGTQISSASAVAPGSVQGQLAWSIQLSLKSSGQKAWADYTSKHNTTVNATDPANLVAYTLDSKVTQAATIQSTITGDTSITGSFTQKTATDFANSLKYGALPLNFAPQEAQTISPTLGSDQLKSGLLAGGIGLLLVIIYSLIYYRALGLVTIASLMVSGAMTYAMLVILGKQIGFTLTLAGIAGFIVAVGITADSFVVFFERIKDEVHEGRTARVAIPRAWVRARRTILSADAVSFLAAATLYYFAAGDVRGFAFTLGLSTVLDLVVVFLFTHPIVSLFSRSAAFGSARFTGLNHVRVGGIASYRNSTGRTSSTRAAGASRSARVGGAGTLVATREADADQLDAVDGDVDDNLDPIAGGYSDAEVRARTRDVGAAATGKPDPARTPTADPTNPPTVNRTAAAPGATAAERAAARRARRDSTAEGNS